MKTISYPFDWYKRFIIKLEITKSPIAIAKRLEI